MGAFNLCLPIRSSKDICELKGWNTIKGCLIHDWRIQTQQSGDGAQVGEKCLNFSVFQYQTVDMLASFR